MAHGSGGGHEVCIRVEGRYEENANGSVGSSRVHQTVPSYTFFKRATFDDGFKCMGYGRLTIMRVYGFTFSSEQLDPDSGGTSKPPELLSNKR
jgi:hypothetical protein